MKIRINKYLSECGVASRRKSEEFIKQGRIGVNDNIVMDFSVYIDTSKDKVFFDGELVKPEKKAYYVLNKPKGFITSTDDEKNRKVVTDLIKTSFTLFPVGRLDYNTTGTIILTNDGDFANKIIHPSKKVEKEYLVNLDKPLALEDQHQLTRCITLDKKNSRFKEINLAHKNRKVVKVIAEEGRNRFVKRMFGALGYRVRELHRIRVGKIDCKGLEIGKYRKLTKEEINSF